MVQHRGLNRRRRKALMFSLSKVSVWWDVVFFGRPPWMVEVLAMHGAFGSAKGWRSLLNQMSEDEQKAFEVEHIKEISDVLGEKGVWFNTEVLIAVGEKSLSQNA